MRTITDPESFRNNVSAKLNSKLKESGIIGSSDDLIKMAKNLEKGIYNASIKDATTKNIVKKWDNIHFTQLYIDRLRSIFANVGSEHIVNEINSIFDSMK
jgi:hypothetical protein